MKFSTEKVLETGARRLEINLDWVAELCLRFTYFNKSYESRNLSVLIVQILEIMKRY